MNAFKKVHVRKHLEKERAPTIEISMSLEQAQELFDHIDNQTSFDTCDMLGSLRYNLLKALNNS